MSRPPSPGTSLTHRSGGAGVQLGADVQPGDTASTVGLSYDAESDSPWADWQHVPEPVLSVLDHAQCSPDPGFLTGAEAPRVRRRQTSRGAEFLQRASAWAAGPTMLVVVDATRALESSGGRRFRPVGPWNLEVHRQLVVDEPRTRTGTVGADVAAPGQPSAGTTEADGPDFVDLLPAVVRKQILATVPDPTVEKEYLWRFTFHDKPYRHEAGHLRASDTMMIATVAERDIGTARLRSARSAEQTLDRSAWTVTTLTARLGSSETLLLEAGPEARSLADPTVRRQIG